MDHRDLRTITWRALICQECELKSDEDARGWRTYLASDPDDAEAPPMVASYCPDCAVREFGPVARPSASQSS